MNCEFLVLTREKKKKLEKFIFKLFCGCPSISSYLGWNNSFEFSALRGQMI